MSDAPIVLTAGEPAGIGPEITLKAWQTLGADLPFFWVGDPRHLPAQAPTVEITDPADTAEAAKSGIPVLAHPYPSPATPGIACADHASYVIDGIAMAVDLAQSGKASAICTNPINKKALKDGANFAYPGHTEFLAALAHRDRVVMMLACDLLKVVPATIHIPLHEVPDELTADLLRDTIEITHRAMQQDFGISSPKLAIAGLNPHAGEGGAIGHEEQNMIIPLLEDMRAEGYTLIGPMPGDTMFHAPARAKYDAAIAMYHDQALIPIKTLDFSGGVNVTLGLPFIRTSPDHGTAFDIAGKGIADADSLIAALKLAQQMAQARSTT